MRMPHGTLHSLPCLEFHQQCRRPRPHAGIFWNSRGRHLRFPESPRNDACHMAGRFRLINFQRLAQCGMPRCHVGEQLLGPGQDATPLESQQRQGSSGIGDIVEHDVGKNCGNGWTLLCRGLWAVCACMMVLAFERSSSRWTSKGSIDEERHLM